MISLNRFIGRSGNTAFLLALIVLAVVIEPILLNDRAMRNVLTTANPLMIVAAGQALTMLTGGIDLSVTSVISLANVIAAFAMQRMPEYAGLIALAAVLAGIFVGSLNGWLVSYARLNPFISTLAIGMAVQGLTLEIMHEPSGQVTAGFRVVARMAIGPVPVMTIVIAVAFMVLAVLLRQTPHGVALFAIGGNEASARMSGLPTRRLKLTAYMASGMLSACAGLFLASRVGSGDPLIGDPYSLDSITAAVLGGTSLVGGVINLAGAAVASTLLALINTLLNLKGISPFFQWIVKGAILIAALSLDLMRHQRRRS
jgi:ribose/xylose/arabinose/galactoside ABC-type transport system permease subunit